ncbi:class I SAM-dependent methyltransferase [Streptomyces lavendulocolor]|uniref:class I SAM-dependent methyltransferase n=1 Tax=Streptomyces lavendulocolor TaxID=67316 RepID=UPI0033DE4A74
MRAPRGSPSRPPPRRRSTPCRRARRVRPDLGLSAVRPYRSPVAIAWAEERAREAGADVRFHRGDAFALAGTELTGPYDLVYDSGCFHHLPPHRRVSYLALLDDVLAPGGHFGLTCFAAGGMGSEEPDAALYRQSRLHGGLAYTPGSLRWIFSDLEEVELRRTRDEPPGSACFGEPFLHTALFARPRPAGHARPGPPAVPGGPDDRPPAPGPGRD